MKALLALALIATTACPQKDTPGSADSSGVGTPGDVARTASEDSLLDLLPPGKTALTPHGDTLSKIGGAVVHGGPNKNYLFDEYWKNGTRYLRVQRAVGQRPDGSPELSTRSRLALPTMGPAETLKFPGSCRTNGQPAPGVLAIVTANGEPVLKDVRHAWIFDLASETLRGIGTTGVSCVDAAGR
jgi:hypothetical protein